MNTKRTLLMLAAMSLAVGQVDAAPVLDTSGDTVGGTTLSLDLNTSGITNDGDLTISNDGSGNLVVAVKSTTVNTDWFITFTGLNVDTSIYQYVQVDFSAVSNGAVDGGWSVFWNEVGGDSTIGGANNSFVSLGTVSVQPTPYSVVIDLTNGGTETSGAKGWGPASVNNFRIDLYEGVAANKGESFTISGVTFGSTLVPEPSSLALLGLGGLLVARRRRK